MVTEHLEAGQRRSINEIKTISVRGRTLVAPSR